MVSKIEKHFEFFKSILDGSSEYDWDEWWKKNNQELYKELSKREYLGLKHRKVTFAKELLEKSGINVNTSYNFCNSCGSRTFVATPKKTTIKEIAEFYNNKNIKVDVPWIHPGSYCTECDWFILLSFRTE